MYRFFERFSRFFRGRYGIDKFEKFLFFVYLFLAVINIFVRNYFAHYTLYIIQLALFAFMLFRSMSRNFYNRQKENETYERVMAPVSKFLKYQMLRIKDVKYKRYRRCPHCKAVARLPIKRGKHTVKCPACRGVYTVRIIF